MNTASKNEMNVEAPTAPELPLIEGLLMPWTKDRSILVEGIAKFRPKTEEPLDRWIPGLHFRTRRGGLVYHLVVERYIPAKHIPWTTQYTGRGANYRRHDVLPRTIPHVVVVRVIAVEPAR